MSATNSTTYYELPVFIATDKPAWLTDWNGAMNAIDTAIKEALTAGENAQTTANTATTSIATINDSLTTINTSLTTLTSTVTGLVGSVNTINSLIGNGEPTTSDKTLIGAINEIYAMIGGGTEVDADIVSYDNTSSGLTATNVQDAIDEIASGSGAGYDFDLTAHTGSATVTSSTGTVDSDNTIIKYALNADKSIGKIYGGISVGSVTAVASDWGTFAVISSSDFPTPQSQYEIYLGMINVSVSNSPGLRAGKMVFKTDGTIELMVKSGSSASYNEIDINLPAYVHFLSQSV